MNTPKDIEQAEQAFIAGVTAAELKTEAGKLVFTAGMASDVYRANGGPVAVVIRNLLISRFYEQLFIAFITNKGEMQAGQLDELVGKLLKHYDLVDYYPPVPMYRDVKALIANVSGVLNKMKLRDADQIRIVNWLLFNQTASAEEVFLMSYDDVEKELIETKVNLT